MSTSARILRNIASSWVGFATNALVTLLLTPFVLADLGTARYGLWAVTASIIGYYGLLDFGIRGGINQFLTRYLAVGNHAAARQSLSTAVTVLSGVGVACAALTFAAAAYAPRLLDLPPGTEREAYWCILVVGLTSAVQFIFFPFMSVFVATQRFDLANLIGVSTRLLGAALVVFALHAGYGLIGLSIATCAANLVDYLVRWRVARRIAPTLTVSAGDFSRASLRELASFGIWTFLLSVNTFIYRHGQPLIIAALLPISAVGHYALAVGVLQQLMALLAPVGQVMYPVAAGAHAQGDAASLRRLYHDGSRLMMLVMLSIVLIAAFWAHDFYRLWIGEQFVAGGEYPSVALLLRVLLVAIVCNYVSNIAAQLLLGAGHVRPYALLLIFGSALNISIMLALMPRYGLLGAALATVAASVVVDLFAMPLLLQRLVGLRVVEFMRTACLRPVACAGLLALALAGIRLLPAPSGWGELLLQGLLGAASAAAIVLAIGVTADERQRLVLRPLSRLLGRHAAPAKASAGGSLSR
jgi:O-antigen/teichoic acid export membrane protein